MEVKIVKGFKDILPPETHGDDNFRQQLTRLSHKRDAADVLVVPRAFAHEAKAGRRAAVLDNGLRAALVKAAFDARLHVSLDSGKLGPAPFDFIFV